MTDGYSLQDLGDGQYRVSGVRVNPSTGKYVTRKEPEPWYVRAGLATDWYALYQEASAAADKMEAAIETAPHACDCSWPWPDDEPNPDEWTCTCWKATAIGS